jgi:hypothetical protein
VTSSHRLIPQVEDFTSAPVLDGYDDMVNPPGLTNHVAVVQVDHDVTAVRSLNVPPVSTGDTITGQLYLDGRLARSYGSPVECVWRPDRVTRSTTIGTWTISTVTVCPPGAGGVLTRIDIHNNGADDAGVELGLAVESAVVHAGHPWIAQIDEPWGNPFSPTAPNSVTVDGPVRIGQPNDRSATAVQGLHALEGDWTLGGPAHQLQASATIPAGQTRSVAYGYAIASARDTDDGGAAAALADFRAMVTDVEAALAASTAAWNTGLGALFTPGDDEFSGCLPVLHTDNDALRALYWWGAMGVLWFRRDNPASVLGRTYDTLMPRHWQTTTFIWDYSLSSQVHALLDPVEMRRQVAHWVGLDIHSHFGTEWLTGGPVGYWYSVNDYAMTRLLHDYLRFTGDLDFLDLELAAADGSRATMAQHAQDWARAWLQFRTDSGLADYGGIDNLLECVPGYTHEVASLNAANVWCLRRAAEIADLQDRSDDAAGLRAEATDLAALVQTRYVDGAGYFRTGMPDGSTPETRHCYDFATVGTTIADDLPVTTRDEMVAFFVRELRTPSWMRALSPADADAAFSVRPDHQWNGAYPAWPPDSARSAIALGHPEVVAEWIDGLARSTLQGPPGQAHFVEEAAPPVAGGARKSPAQFPYLIDWACSSAGAWCELVISGVFGVEVDLDGTVRSRSVLDRFDPHARLTGLVVQGRSHAVDGRGVHREDDRT